MSNCWVSSQIFFLRPYISIGLNVKAFRLLLEIARKETNYWKHKNMNFIESESDVLINFIQLTSPLYQRDATIK